MKESTAINIMILALLAMIAINFSLSANAQDTANTTNIDGIEQRNQSSVTSTGSYTQNNVGGPNFGQGTIPTYNRKGDVQCATPSMSADAFALNNDASIGSFRLGVTIPLFTSKCESAFDDEVAVTLYRLHVLKVEQSKKDILFQQQMSKVCMGLHQVGIVINKSNVLYEACQQFQPAQLSHGDPHPEDPYISGFGKPAAHQHERAEMKIEILDNTGQ